MKKAFTLLEMLIVVVILSILMSIVFRIGSITSTSDARATTIRRLQCLENCLSGYYAAFGSYPPVKLHGSQNPYLEVDSYNIQGKTPNKDIFSSNDAESEARACRQIEAACRAQPVMCNFPFSDEFREYVEAFSDEVKSLVTGSDDSLKDLDSESRAVFSAGFDLGGGQGGTGRFSGNSNKSDWRHIQLFRFGLMSFLLPRYLVMMNGTQDFYSGKYKQWDDNNTKPCDPFTGESMSWLTIKELADKTLKGAKNANDAARLANIPTQAVCARWIPNLQGICKGMLSPRYLYGVNVMQSSMGNIELSISNLSEIKNNIFSPGGYNSGSNEDQYLLDGITVQDGWGVDFYYYSPPPYQKYTLWSSGENKKTFPPWIARQKLNAQAQRKVASWTSDDVIHMSK